MFSETTEKRVVAFINSIANDCRGCMKRSVSNCEHCRGITANSIMVDISADEKAQKSGFDLSSKYRGERVKAILKSAGKPLLAKEIDISDLCSYQLKHWTLKTLISCGEVGRRIAHRYGKKNVFCYFLKKQGDETNENHNV